MKKTALEFFAGKRSFGRQAKKRGYKVFSVEIDPQHNCNMTMDIMDYHPHNYPDIIPDVIWASPDCTSFSIAGIRYHRKNGIAFSEKAILGDRLLKKTIDLIDHYLIKNPKLKYSIENPVGLMRKQKILLDFLSRTNGKIETVTYCQYGFKYMKPTDIFTNIDFFGKKCKRGSSCHISSPRGSSTGLTSIKKGPMRSIIPAQLIIDILDSYETK